MGLLAVEDCSNKHYMSKTCYYCWFPHHYNLVPVTQDYLIWAAV